MPDTAQEIKSLRERLALLESIVLDGKPYTPGMEEWQRAVEAVAERNDWGPYLAYKARGGIIPEPSEKNSGHVERRERKHAASRNSRISKPTAGRHLGSGSSSPS